MNKLTEDFERIPSITPWEQIEVGKVYITPKVHDIPRTIINVLSKDVDSAECEVRSGNITEKVTIHRLSIAAKFMVEEIKF